MPSNPTYTDEQIIAAILESQGLLAVAARRLGCTRQTIYDRIQTSPAVAKAMDDARETTKDYAEGKLFEHMKKDNLRAVMFYLSTQAKDRGYVKKTETEITGQMTEDEAAALAKRLGIQNWKLPEGEADANAS